MKLIYKVSRDLLEDIYLKHLKEGLYDTRWMFPINVFLIGIYSIAVSIILLIFLPIVMFFTSQAIKEDSRSEGGLGR